MDKSKGRRSHQLANIHYHDPITERASERKDWEIAFVVAVAAARSSSSSITIQKLYNDNSNNNKNKMTTAHDTIRYSFVLCYTFLYCPVEHDDENDECYRRRFLSLSLSSNPPTLPLYRTPFLLLTTNNNGKARQGKGTARHGSYSSTLAVER